MKYINQGDAIEGKRVDIKTRKQNLQTSVEIDDIGRCFKYLCQKNATATVIEVLNVDSETKKEKINKKIHMEIDDCVSGDSVDLYSLDLLRFSKEANFSSKHGIQSSETNRFGRAQVRVPFRFALSFSRRESLE